MEINKKKYLEKKKEQRKKSKTKQKTISISLRGMNLERETGKSRIEKKMALIMHWKMSIRVHLRAPRLYTEEN